MVVFSSVRLGVSPKINALASLIILVVSIATFIGWWMMAAAEKRRKAEIAVAMQNRCGILSHVEVSIHSMMRVAHGRSDSVESGLLSKVSMRNWRIGWGWKLRTTIGMRDWIENGRKICILYSPFIIYTIIATSHYTTSYMSVSSTWKYMWSLMIK
jgi:hypothetical protein